MGRKILEVIEVEKRFEKVQAVAGLSFAIHQGEIFALLGPNGAGKTTMVRMLLGLFKPDQGAINYMLSGESRAKPRPAELGYLPEDRGLYKDTQVLSTLVYFGVLRGMERRTARKAAEQWLERVGLLDRSNAKVDALSKGNQQKVQFIASILHQPAFAVLDEPFSGLDPVNQDFFLELMHELRASGVTILLSAHQMQLVERVADRLLLINRGREVIAGSLEEIRQKTQGGNKLILKVKDSPDLSVFDRCQAVENARLTAEREITLLVKAGESLSDLLVMIGSHLEIISIHSEQLSLHDIYVQAVGIDRAPAQVEVNA